MTEWAERHVAAPTLAVAHTERLTSANKSERTKIAKLLNLSPEQNFSSTVDKNSFVQKARSALVSIISPWPLGDDHVALTSPHSTRWS